MKAKINLPITFVIDDITPEMTDEQIAEKLRERILEDGLAEYVNADNLRITREDYPRTIGFACHPGKGLTPDAQQWVERIRGEVRITLLDENIIQIDYPSDIVKQIRTVNVDDTIFRLDFIDPANKFWNCNSVFPDVPWKRQFMQERFSKGVRSESDGRLIIDYSN